jgi:hypothetical protein
MRVIILAKVLHDALKFIDETPQACLDMSGISLVSLD